MKSESLKADRPFPILIESGSEDVRLEQLAQLNAREFPRGRDSARHAAVRETANVLQDLRCTPANPALAPHQDGRAFFDVSGDGVNVELGLAVDGTLLISVKSTSDPQPGLRRVNTPRGLTLLDFDGDAVNAPADARSADIRMIDYD